MKTRNIFLLALTALLTVSCHSWDDPSEEAGLKSIGNQYIQATNVKTIAEIKSSFQNEINNNGLKQVTKPTQIQGIVIGDDAGSNLYKQIYVQDATGALCISINKSGLFSETAVGQCVMIELEGLYVGGYGKQGQVGISYTDPSKENATAQVGRMSRYTWDEHFKLIPAIEGLSVKPITLRSLESLDLAADCGKLVKLVGVKLKNADGKIVFAPSDGSAKLVGGCVNRDIDGMSNVVVRTSTYAKFANEVMPTEKVNITGIAARYNDTWQIMPRTADDIELTTGNEEIDDPNGDAIFTASFESGQGDFTIDDKDLGGLTFVWKADNKGYMKASAYANNANNATESWLVSPAFSLKNATEPVMTFNNACNYIKEGTITDHIKVMVFDGTNWAEATIANLPDGKSWTFVDSSVDLKVYAGKENVKVAFKYVSTTAVAPTWEVKTVTIK